MRITSQRPVRDLLAFGARDLGYIMRWPVVGHLRRADPGRYADPPNRRSPDVVLLPGVYETWQFMRPIAEALYARGHAVHAVTTLGHNSGAVDEMGVRAAAFLEDHDLDDVVVVAHSKGGLIGKYVMAHTRAGHRVREMVTVNTPFSGSVFGHVIPMRAVRHFRPRHPTISMLNENLDVNHRITSICSRYDPLIRSHEAMNGAAEVDVDTVGHFTVLKDPLVLQTIIDVVERAAPDREPAHAQPSA